MEECASVIDTQGVQAERAMMPLAAAVAGLLKGGDIFHPSTWFLQLSTSLCLLIL